LYDKSAINGKLFTTTSLYVPKDPRLEGTAQYVPPTPSVVRILFGGI
jgi:hypothetical protein